MVAPEENGPCCGKIYSLLHLITWTVRQTTAWAFLNRGCGTEVSRMLRIGSDMMMMRMMRMINEDDESTLPLLSIGAHHLGVNGMCRSEPARRRLAAPK